MKKQNENKLAFIKAVVTELNILQLNNVNGGVKEGETDTNTISGCICSPLKTKITIFKQN